MLASRQGGWPWRPSGTASYQYVYLMKNLSKIFPGGKKVLENITLAGRIAHARELIARMCGLDPKLRLANLPNLMPFQRRVDVERWSDALLGAGPPG
jgi:hypothetical protein